MRKLSYLVLDKRKEKATFNKMAGAWKRSA